MDLDFCTITTGSWAVIGLVVVMAGSVVGLGSAAIFSKSNLGLSGDRKLNLTGGCLSPMAAGLVTAFTVNLALPDEPCGGAFTSNAVFLPAFVLALVTAAAAGSFWLRIRRR